MNPNCSRINVKDQEKNAGSVLSFYKKLTVLRKSEEYKETVVTENLYPIWSRRRISSDISERVRKNFLFLPISRKRQRSGTSGSVKKVLLNNLEDLTLNDNRIHLDSWQFVTLEI